MTEALKSVSQYAFSEFGLIRITAFVLESNMASAKVLEKSGFNFEGTLRKYYRKNNNYLDAKIFAKIRE